MDPPREPFVGAGKAPGPAAEHVLADFHIEADRFRARGRGAQQDQARNKQGDPGDHVQLDNQSVRRKSAQIPKGRVNIASGLSPMN